MNCGIYRQKLVTYLSHNQLTTLPTEVGNLTNLEYVDISNNELSSLPGESGHLSNFDSFDCRND